MMSTEFSVEPAAEAAGATTTSPLTAAKSPGGSEGGGDSDAAVSPDDQAVKRHTHRRDSRAGGCRERKG